MGYSMHICHLLIPLTCLFINAHPFLQKFLGNLLLLWQMKTLLNPSSIKGNNNATVSVRSDYHSKIQMQSCWKLNCCHLLDSLTSLNNLLSIIMLRSPFIIHLDRYSTIHMKIPLHKRSRECTHTTKHVQNIFILCKTGGQYIDSNCKEEGRSPPEEF